MGSVYGSGSWYTDCFYNPGGACENCGQWTRHAAYPNVKDHTDMSCSSIPQLKCYPCSSGTCKVSITNRCNGNTVSNVEIRDTLPAYWNCNVGCGPKCSKPECEPVIDMQWFVFSWIEDLATGRIPVKVFW